MGINCFAISTNHPFNRYTSGQMVKGKVHFKLDETKTIRGIYVELKGIAKVSWTESQSQNIGGKSTKVSVKYVGEHEYFNERIYFVGQPDNPSFDLPPGDYDYKFEYNLPVGLPSSYKDIYGGVNYTVRAVVDIPWGFDDEEEINLEMMSPVDLNARPNLKNSFHVRNTKHLCCLWCRTGPLTIEVDVPQTGYVHGEDIPFRIDIENLSGSTIENIECALNQKVSFHSQYPSHHTRETKRTMSRKILDGVPAKNTKTYEETLGVPSELVLNFQNCNLLDLNHLLKINVKISGCHTDLSAQIPIVLGSVPIRKAEPSAPPMSILTGLGTPYPHEEHHTSSSSNLTQTPFDRTYGWTPTKAYS